VKCPYCNQVFEQTDVLTQQPKVVCKACLKVFHTDPHDPHSTLIGVRDPHSTLHPKRDPH
jgi:hypothetical protein